MPILTIPIELDKTRNLAFTLGAMKALAKREIPTEVASLSEVGLDTITFMLFQLLRWEDPDLTEAQIDCLVDFSNVEYVNGKITELMTAVTKENEKRAKRSGKAPLSGATQPKSTGSNSGHLAAVS